MRGYGTINPTQDAPVAPDTTQVLIIAGSSAQAMDWFAAAAGASANAAAAAAHIVRLTGQTTLGAMLPFFVNLSTTKAAVPTSGASTQGTTGFGSLVLGSGTFQIPGGSTGFSVASLSSGYVVAEIWRK